MGPRQKLTRRRRRLLTLGICLLLVALWVTGVIGRFIVSRVAPMLLPLDLGSGITVTSVGAASPPADAGGMLQLTARPHRVRQMLRESVPFTRFLPPGLLGHGLRLNGVWHPSGAGLPVTNSVALSIVLDFRAPANPHLEGRYPVQDFNKLVRYQYAEKLTRERDWFLGSYDFTWKPEFNTLRIESERGPVERNATRRTLAVNGTGRVRLIFDDDAFKLSVRPRVRNLKGAIDVEVIRHGDGLGLAYDARIHELGVDVKNLAPWADNKVEERLRSSLERSLNRQKKKDRMARKRFPAWLPTDTTVDFELVREGD